jgi:GrpB-like predicted nucleotidyltransferase (UPF0157 family)
MAGVGSLDDAPAMEGCSRRRAGIWCRSSLMRDRLCERPALAGEYAELKRRLAREHADDRDTYAQGKAALVRRVLAGRG